MKFIIQFALTLLQNLSLFCRKYFAAPLKPIPVRAYRQKQVPLPKKHHGLSRD